MKNTLYLLVVTLLFSSCAIKQTVTYEKTNASLIQKSIKDLNTVGNLIYVDDDDIPESERVPQEGSDLHRH